MEISKFQIEISIQKPPEASNLNGNLQISIEISIQKPPKASNLNGNLQMFNGNLHQKASNLNGNLQNFNGHLKQQQQQQHWKVGFRDFQLVVAF